MLTLNSEMVSKQDATAQVNNTNHNGGNPRTLIFLKTFLLIGGMHVSLKGRFFVHVASGQATAALLTPAHGQHP